MHEDDDILGMFSPYEYTHFSPAWSFATIGMFVATFLGVVGIVRVYYPDKPSVERGFEGGLDRELGGVGALHVSTLFLDLESTSFGLMDWQARTQDGID